LGLERPRIALVSALAAQHLDEDLPPLVAALQAAGADVQVANWDDPQVDWRRFDMALLRSTWDYTSRLAEFVDWAERTAKLTELRNPLAVVRWNIDKHYLAQLAVSGIAIVPSEFIEPGQDASPSIDHFLSRHSDTAELVVKPAIGAGSRDAERHARSSRAAILKHAQRLLDGRRSVLLQPYLDRVDDYGETALIFFAGQFSHAIRKGPLLPRGGGSTSALFAPEDITPREATADELTLAQRVMAAIPFEQPLYARVDLIRDASGKPCVLELELAEPSLFFAHSPGSAQRFSAVILAAAQRS
jgi:glutathione synthase/RimK-type ligase-like ATP-grasp enzyme